MFTVTKLIFVIILLSLLTSCDTKSNPDLYVTKRTVTEASGRRIDADTLYAVKDNFFETEFCPFANSTGIAMSMTKQDNLKVDFTSVTVTDSLGKELEFKNKADFLGFMDRRGFEVMSQEQKKYNTQYTFKRKSK